MGFDGTTPARYRCDEGRSRSGPALFSGRVECGSCGDRQLQLYIAAGFLFLVRVLRTIRFSFLGGFFR